MFLFLSSFCYSWTDAALDAAMELMFRSTGDSSKIIARQVADCTKEVYERPSLIGSWIDFVERPPYNIKNFNHWRYTKVPLGIHTHRIKSEDINVTLNSISKSIFQEPSVNGEWQINFAFKTLFGLFLEAFDPTHTTEYYSNELPKGDDNGKQFVVYYGNTKTNLHDFWGTACGRLNGHFPFTDNDYKEIDDFVTETFKVEPATKINPVVDFTQILDESIKASNTSVYEGVSYNGKLSDEYINRCRKVTANRLAKAGYSLGKLLKTVKVPECKSAEKLGKSKAPVSTVAASGYITFFLLLPVSVYLIGVLFKK